MSACDPAQHRFIPACAGNSFLGRRVGLQPPVHPRVCGEQRNHLVQQTAERGSSPRVRGTVRGRECNGFRIRFIPACAGNSGSRRQIVNFNAVHPRVCGEQRTIGVLRRILIGSSPRVRGTVKVVLKARAVPRFIPACAGNRPSISPRLQLSTVHPRVCGEQLQSGGLGGSPPGSSPRVRGTDFTRTVSTPLVRFIPACAGNRPSPDETIAGVPVHPRVCGEQTSLWRKDEVTSGSSPHVRGTASS